MEDYGLITFESTQFALQAESVFKEEKLDFKTIPTPREVSHSCGLSLLIAFDEVEVAKKLILEKRINIDSLYKYSKERHKAKAKKIL